MNVLGEHITMKCVMCMPCIHMILRKHPMTNQQAIKHHLGAVGVIHLVGNPRELSHEHHHMLVLVDCRMIPPDSIVPPLKPADIGGSEEEDGHHIHAEHAMNVPAGN